MYYTKVNGDTSPPKIQPHKPTQKGKYKYNVDIPDQYLPDYKNAIVKFAHHYDFIGDSFHSRFPNPPFSWKDFLTFMKDEIGIKVRIMCFENPTDLRLSGTWEWDNPEKSSITIYVDGNHSPQRQKVTIIHECIHAIQDFDEEFKIELQAYPLAIQMRIADRVAEKAAIEILMPRKMIEQDKREKMSLWQMLLKYQVSGEMIGYA